MPNGYKRPVPRRSTTEKILGEKYIASCYTTCVFVITKLSNSNKTRMQSTVMQAIRSRVPLAVRAASGGRMHGRRGVHFAAPMLRSVHAASSSENTPSVPAQRNRGEGRGLGRKYKEYMTPYRFMQDFEQEMNDMMRGFGLTNLRDMPLTRGDMSLAVDIEESRNAFLISADIPGLKASDVKVDVSPDHVLTISGERKNETSSEENGVVRMERSYGSFVRSLRLPDHVDVHGITAEAEKGVLKVTVPKKDEEKVEPKTISISVSGSE